MDTIDYFYDIGDMNYFSAKIFNTPGSSNQIGSWYIKWKEEEDLWYFKLHLKVSSVYLIYDTPYYANGREFIIPLNPVVRNKRISQAAFEIHMLSLTPESEFLKIKLENCMYMTNSQWDWYEPDEKCKGI